MFSPKIVWLFSLTPSFSVASQFFVDQSIQPSLETSPVGIQLQQSGKPGIITATLENKGLDTIYLPGFEPAVQIFTAKDQPVSFYGDSDGFYDMGANTTNYGRLAAGASTSWEIDVISKYRLVPGRDYFTQAGGFLEYQRDSQSSMPMLSTPYESNVLQFSVPVNRQPNFAKTNDISAKENYVWTGCTDKGLDDKLKASIPIAINWSQKAADHALNGKNRAAFTAYFKSDSPENRKLVAGRFSAMVDTLSKQGGVTRLGCGDGAKSQCAKGNPNALAWTVAQTGVITFCAKAKTYPVQVGKCTNAVFPGVLIHELSHSAALFKPNTVDAAMTNVQCKALSEAKALRNANNFNLYAQSVVFDTVC